MKGLGGASFPGGRLRIFPLPLVIVVCEQLDGHVEAHLVGGPPRDDPNAVPDGQIPRLLEERVAEPQASYGDARSAP